MQVLEKLKGVENKMTKENERKISRNNTIFALAMVATLFGISHFKSPRESGAGVRSEGEKAEQVFLRNVQMSRGAGTEYVVVREGETNSYLFSGTNYLGEGLTCSREQDNSPRYTLINPEGIDGSRKQTMGLK